MTRIGIFGGSFDPPHLAHLRVAKSACDHFDLDTLLWVPAGIPPHKQNQKLSAVDHRISMTRMMVSEDPRFDLDLRETRNSGPSYSITTLVSVKKEHPEARLFLILGEDQLLSFSSWRQPEEILKLAHILCYHRSHAEKKKRDTSERSDIASATAPFSSHQVSWLPGEPVAISSTDIRNTIRTGGSVKSLVCPAIETYIKSHGLYLPA